MSNPYVSATNPTSIPQSEPLLGRDQIVNRAGGYVFKIDPWQHLDRFLILGTEGGTYYASEREFTRESIESVLKLISIDGVRVVNRTVEISDSGRAPRNTPAIFTLAACSVYGDELTKTLANSSLSRVCRTGTHLFQWSRSLHALNGHGPSGAGQRRALARWYTEKSPDQLAYQLAKYQQREGWSHRDLLRLCKPGSKQVAEIPTPEHRACLGWATQHGTDKSSDGEIQELTHLPQLLAAFESVKSATSDKNVARLIIDAGLTREMIPSQWLDSPLVWEALLVKMPLEATIRNLGKMSAIDLLKPLSNAESVVVSKLSDLGHIKKSRLHPVSILNSFKVYGSGHGVRGSLSWSPSQNVLSTLESAFNLAFSVIEPTNKRIYIAIDGSGSMTYSQCIGLESLTCVEGASAMAMVTAQREPRFYAAGFDGALKLLNITRRTSFQEVVRQLGRGGYTDASIPFRHAMKDNLEVDTFIVYTDNETWAGPQHPCVALDKYRQKTGIPAKLVIVAMSATNYSIGDRDDVNTLNVVGFDSAAPSVIADFVKN